MTHNQSTDIGPSNSYVACHRHDTCMFKIDTSGTVSSCISLHYYPNINKEISSSQYIHTEQAASSWCLWPPILTTSCCSWWCFAHHPTHTHNPSMDHGLKVQHQQLFYKDQNPEPYAYAPVTQSSRTQHAPCAIAQRVAIWSRMPQSQSYHKTHPTEPVVLREQKVQY
jgi:hypothetical protein